MTQISCILQDNVLNSYNNNNNNNNNEEEEEEEALFCITAAFSHMYHQFPNAHSLLFLAHSDTHNTTQHQTNTMTVCNYHSQPLIVLNNTINSSKQRGKPATLYCQYSQQPTLRHEPPPIKKGLEYFLGASCIIHPSQMSHPPETVEFKKVPFTI
jgi:hypothetical protein